MSRILSKHSFNTVFRALQIFYIHCRIESIVALLSNCRFQRTLDLLFNCRFQSILAKFCYFTADSKASAEKSKLEKLKHLNISSIILFRGHAFYKYTNKRKRQHWQNVFFIVTQGMSDTRQSETQRHIDRKQCCGSVWIRFILVSRIRIRFNETDPDPGSKNSAKIMENFNKNHYNIINFLKLLNYVY